MSIINYPLVLDLVDGLLQVCDQILGIFQAAAQADQIGTDTGCFQLLVGDIYVNGRLLYFEREKAKELFALLVDRCGAALTTEQIASVLWESKNYNTSLKNAVTKVVASLRNTLKAEGIEDILIKRWNHLAVDTKKFECDAYEYEKQVPRDRSSFRGEYMTNYSWAEYSIGRYIRMDEEAK